MKSIGTESGPAQGSANGKDKQTLVLFLLAGCILGLPFLHRQEPPAQVVYAIERNADTTRWQVVSAARDAAWSRESDEGLVHPFSRQSGVSMLFSDIYEKDFLPAELTLFFHRPLPLNTSRLEDLTMLPGIGPRRAAMLIAERERKGRLQGPEDLLAVPGIGPVTLRRLLPLVSFE